MSKIVSWHTSNGVKVCNRWLDSDAPGAATLITTIGGGAFMMVAPNGAILEPPAETKPTMWNCRIVFNSEPQK